MIALLPVVARARDLRPDGRGSSHTRARTPTRTTAEYGAHPTGAPHLR